MYRFYLNKARNAAHFAELIRVFLADDDFEALKIEFDDASGYKLTDKSYLVNPSGFDDQEKIKQELYHLLAEITGKHPEWGTLTGVRPLKPAFRAYFDQGKSIDRALGEMQRTYLLSDEKAALLGEILEYQVSHIGKPDDNSASIYAGVPFCPTRCSYCSFAAAIADDDRIAGYLNKLLEEIEYAGGKNEYSIESIYIGGGTPTTLTPAQFESLIGKIYDSFDIEPGSVEFTVEAGRPDTIDREKLSVLRSLGVTRISINPQSMHQSTLDAIGRSHSPVDIRNAFMMADEINFDSVNADIIAGLPGEKPCDFADTLNEVIALGADNITVHTLSVKRGSVLNETDPEYFRRYGDDVREMLRSAGNTLRKNGYSPYYIYRQKHQIGALENIGWCREGKHSIYNIRIMEDEQTIIGLGAGAVGKIWYPQQKKLERVPNVSDPDIYISRFDEMLKRKDRYFGG